VLLSPRILLLVFVPLFPACRAVAAAVIKARDTAADELFLVMPTYSKQLGRCTPRDKEQQFKPYSIRGSLAVDKRKVQAPASNIDGRRL
jgi:hypothetical protein